jgi:hypothetical protein
MLQQHFNWQFNFTVDKEFLTIHSFLQYSVLILLQVNLATSFRLLEAINISFVIDYYTIITVSVRSNKITLLKKLYNIIKNIFF